MASLFISRKLSPDSRFHSLRESGITVFDKSLIEIKRNDFGPVPNTDWIFFYSKNGIDFYFEKEPWNSSKKYAVMGEASAVYFQKLIGHPVNFKGTGNPDQTALAFQELLTEASVLFVKAKNSRDSVASKLGDHIECVSVVAYENIPIKDFDLPNCQYLVFTSPLNAESWFRKYKYRDQNIFAIGPSTAEIIYKQIQLEVPFPEKPGEDALFELVIKNI